MQTWTRRAALAATIGAGLVLVACGAQKPETTVKNFYKLIDGRKTEEAIALFAVKHVPAEQMTTARGKLMAVVGQMQETMSVNGGLDEVVIVQVDTPMPEEVIVRSTLKYKNGKTQDDRIKLVQEDGRWRINPK